MNLEQEITGFTILLVLLCKSKRGFVYPNIVLHKQGFTSRID